MPVQKPYYGLHQVIAGKYTPGNEYVLENGDEYVGAFHVLPNGQVFTDTRPRPNSQELFVKRNDLSESVKLYNRVMKLKVPQYDSPVAIQPMLTSEDYERGEIQRFFVQKRNNPLTTIVEIDSVQYNAINKTNSPGLNGVIWNKALLYWKISLMPPDDAATLNRRELERSERSFPGIITFVPNALEFYR